MRSTEFIFGIESPNEDVLLPTLEAIKLVFGVIRVTVQRNGPATELHVCVQFEIPKDGVKLHKKIGRLILKNKLVQIRYAKTNLSEAFGNASEG